MKKRLGMFLVTGLSVLLFTVGFAGCDDTSSNTGSGHEHVFAEYEYNQDATCTQDGTETATCIFCTATYTRVKEGSALGHDYFDEYTVDVRPTCTETGICSRHCSRCNSTTDERVVESLGHNLIHHNAQAATCTKKGWNAYDTCSRCDYTTYREIAVLDHDIIHHEGQTATCTEKGWNAYDTCSRCDYTTYREIAALNHANMQAHIAVEATCTTAGNSAYWYCPDCDKYFSDANGQMEIADNSWILAALNHANMQSHAAVDATCITAGNSAYCYCPDCDMYFSDVEGKTEIAENSWVIAALNHDLIHHDAQAATCAEKGWNAYDTCSRCDYTTYLEIEAHHDLIHHDAKFASCTEKGWEAYDTCSRCDYTTYREIAMLGHDLIYHDARAATCTDVGWNAYEQCSRCSYTTYQEVSELGHSYINGACVRCGKTDPNYTAEATEGLKYEISYNGKYYCVIGIGSATDKDVVIPSTYNGLPVTKIDEYAFSYCTKLESVVIPDSITSIESSAFSSCFSLKSVTMGSGVTYISDRTFSDCTALETITIGSNVALIGDLAFFDCSSLKSITFPNSVSGIWDQAFEDCASLEIVNIPYGVNEIRDRAFAGCTSLKSVYYYGTEQEWNKIKIGSNNQNLTNAVLLYLGEVVQPNTPTEGLAYKIASSNTYYTVIGIGTATDENIVIPSIYNGLPVKEIGTSAFYNCSSLRSVTIPNSITSIGNGAFEECTSLTNIYFNAENCKDLRFVNRVFYNAGKNRGGITLTIGAAVTKIPAYLFSPHDGSYAPQIVDLEFEAGSVCRSIGRSAFYGCSSLINVSIPDSVTTIGIDAFASCASLTSVFIGSGATSISNSAFRNCPLLESIMAQEDNLIYHSSENCLIETASKTLILGCKNSVIPADGSVTSIGNSAFDGCSSLLSVTIPKGITSINKYAFHGCLKLNRVIISDGVISIGYGAFQACVSLGSVVIPDGVESVGDYAFAYCTNLADITIPDSVAYIGISAFEKCSFRLTSVVIGNGVVSIGNSAFAGCSKLKNVTIGNSVTIIGNYAFEDCASLVSVSIPESVTYIGFEAFAECVSLETVYYYGSGESWNYINIDASNTDLVNASIIFLDKTTKKLK